MQNLKLFSEISSEVKLQSEGEVIRFAALDIEQNRLFFASSTNSIYTTPLPSSQSEGAWNKTLLSTTNKSLQLEPGDYITSFDYLMEKEALVVGTSYGLILLYLMDDDATEIVGRVEGGVKCISPSPDGDVLCIISGFGQILVMTHDWDLLYETSIDDATEDAGVSESYFSSNYSLESPISWRGDGKFFATLSATYGSPSMHKKLKVWERDSGALHSVSEAKPFVGSVLDWMPSGAKIATVCECKDKKKCPSIVFFERNGLERSSFNIIDNANATIVVLSWNCSSNLLAAIVKYEKYDILKIWFFSNNHWYLKHEIRYSKQDGVRFMWDPIKALQLICWTCVGQVTIFNFVWITAVMENSTALVVDDFKILVTPFSLSLIPPPLYLFSLRFPSAVIDLSFCSKVSKNYLAASLSDGSLCIVGLPELDTWEEFEGKEFNVEISSSETRFGTFAHLVWLDDHVLLGITHFGFSHSSVSELSFFEGSHTGYYLQEIELSCLEDHKSDTMTCSGWHGKVSNQVSLEGQVVSICSNPTKKNSAFLQFDGGKVFEYLSHLRIKGEVILKKYEGMGFSSSCPWMQIVSVGGLRASNAWLFGLDDNGRLFVNGKLLCHNCSSFSFYSSSADQLVTHLLLSTKQDLLFVMDITDILLGQLELKYDNFLPIVKKRNEDSGRSYINIWERGARIAGVLHGDEPAVILQTTRGNIECIYPRKLILDSIINALRQQRFQDAILMVRRHRIDFNVIVDHCGWQSFLQSVVEFVKQVNNLSHITEFVCAMKNENVMDTLYKNYICQSCVEEPKIMKAKSLDVSSNGKVSSVLLAIRKALEGHIVESPTRELCILTTLACSDPPALEEALNRIKIIREMELSNSNDPRRKSNPSSEESLKHLLWLSDSEAVYEAALGLYDLNLASLVALNSQKDPKEFLPFLETLERMPALIMRYNIDLRLERHECALKHIVSAGNTYHEETMKLLKKNPQLFSLGVQLIIDPSKRRQVLEAWGDHLSDVKCFEDAATTYSCCLCLEKALKAYRACGNWGGVLTVAGLIKLGKEEILQLAHELCEELQALGRPGEAAKIALEYCGDVNGGISFLITARDWEEALRIAFMNKREDLVLEVKNASLECACVLISEYEEGLEKVGKYLTRYLAVRQRRLLLAAKLQSDERPTNELDDDTASEASSNLSGMSAYTTGTRKSTAASMNSSMGIKGKDIRRQRNRGKIRAGSPGEEMALVEHLKGMSPTAGSKRELKSLLVSLLTFGEEDTARKLQRFGENFQVSQMAAVKLAEDAMSSDCIDEQAFSLNHYVHKVRKELQHSEEFLSWQSKVLIPA